MDTIIGVLGGEIISFCQNSILFSSQGGQVLQFVPAKIVWHAIVSNCSASLNIGKKLLNNGKKTGKKGRKIGKYGKNQTKMAEHRKTWQKNWLNMEEKGIAGH